MDRYQEQEILHYLKRIAEALERIAEEQETRNG